MNVSRLVIAKEGKRPRVADRADPAWEDERGRPGEHVW